SLLVAPPGARRRPLALFSRPQRHRPTQSCRSLSLDNRPPAFVSQRVSPPVFPRQPASGGRFQASSFCSFGVQASGASGGAAAGDLLLQRRALSCSLRVSSGIPFFQGILIFPRKISSYSLEKIGIPSSQTNPKRGIHGVLR
ncbi:Eukaryotic translation initiation factor 3 subunit C, partial [Zea mays]